MTQEDSEKSHAPKKESIISPEAIIGRRLVEAEPWNSVPTKYVQYTAFNFEGWQSCHYCISRFLASFGSFFDIMRTSITSGML